ncbi:MAG TPA: glycosyltransferase family 39 protein [Acidimicrobiales bacterium]|jgi:4-amino-4-deoxy-L-arabinose transferase-like glycosyltransferase|nr:glycosyltransferase family 39 protein [Acidimicrobiales bacterium]
MTTTLDRADLDTGSPVPPEGPASPPQSRLRRVIAGKPDDPRWVRPTLLLLLAFTALGYLWALGDSGWANSFYSAAVQAGTKSWKAFFFGSSDASNFITVDKPPASLWVMELSARLFGVNAWSILVPQALEGVATVGVLYATVRRWFSPAAALLAGAVMAMTPVAVLMFRFNNPDALLVLLLTVAAYATVRALERAQTSWLVVAMACVGTGFITKMLQAFVIIPVIGLVYLLFAPTPLGRRIRQLLAAAVALAVSAGWWVAAVALTPASSRPYIGGSQDNNILNLIFGYNGFGRLSGNETGSVGGAGAAGSRWGATGWSRLFGSDMGGQISWLLPAALVLLGAGLWITLRSARTDRTRAALVLWGGWLLLTGAIFSFAAGIIHPYYTVALAPAVAALVGIGSVMLWQRRSQLWVRIVLGATLALTGVWAYVLLHRTPNWLPGLRVIVLLAGIGIGLVIAIAPRLRGRIAAAVVAVGLISASLGPAAYAIDTIVTPHSGAIPAAGPATAGGFGGPGGGGPGGFAGRPGAGAAGGLGPRPGGAGGFPGGAGGAPPGAGAGAAGGFRRGLGGANPGGGAAFGGGGGGAGGLGGILNASTPGQALVTALEKDAGQYTWAAATVSSNSASGYQLATGDPVMAIGGFNGTDPAPTLAQFEQYVQQGKIHYFIAGGRGGAGGGSTATADAASQITSWVESHFTAQTVSGQTIYNLTQPTSTTGLSTG